MGVTICNCKYPNDQLPSSQCTVQDDSTQNSNTNTRPITPIHSKVPSSSKNLSANCLNILPGIVKVKPKSSSKSSFKSRVRSSAYLTRNVLYVLVIGAPLCGKRTFVMNGKKRSAFDRTNEYRKQYNNGKGIIYEIVYEIVSSKKIEKRNMIFISLKKIYIKTAIAIKRKATV